MNNFLSYGKQWIDEEDIQAVVKVLKGDYLTQGAAINAFEKELCAFTGARYSIALANGTAALHLAVAALGDLTGCEGITSPNSFVASANCFVYNHMKPVFADIETDTYNISPKEILKKITSKTKLLIPVHFAGQPARMEEIHAIAQEKNCFIIEDAAHAIGSYYEDGLPVGCCARSDMTIFSFHPVKTITTGEGGAITTNNKKLYEQLLLLRTHGITKECYKLTANPGPWYYEMQELGFNYRLTDIQAALGLSQIKKLTTFKKRRKEIVVKYNKAFKDVDWLTIPFEREDLDSCFHLYVLLFDFDKLYKTRKQVMDELKKKNIGTQVHYIPIHTQPYYKSNYGYNWGDCPAAEIYYEKALSIPLYPKLSDTDVDYIIKNILDLAILTGSF